MMCSSFEWKNIEKVSDKLEESRNQLNIDILLQKISFFERGFQCLFDDDQIMLLYLQEKISLAELKKQRNLMEINIQKEEETPGNEIANNYFIEE